MPQACPVCSQMLDGDGSCPNWLCDDPGRRIERIDAIAYLSGELRDRIHWYKYEGRTGWSLIFGRLLLGWLEANAADDPPDLIVANPTYIAPGLSRALGTSRASSGRPRQEDLLGRWPFDVRGPARPSSRPAQRRSPPGAPHRRNGQRPRAPAGARVPDPARTAGRRHPRLRRRVHHRKPAQRRRRLPARPGEARSGCAAWFWLARLAPQIAAMVVVLGPRLLR